jgi:hypothetical protein
MCHERLYPPISNLCLEERTMNDLKNKNQLLSRREILKVLAATGGATALSTLPTAWEKPFVKAGALPVFAQTSPGQYPFTNEIESIEFEGAGSDQLEVAQYPGWLVVSERGSTSKVGPGKAAPLAYSPLDRPWIKIKRKWEVFSPPWVPVIKVKIKIKFYALPGFEVTDVPVDDTDFWFFGISGVNLDLFSYYVTKLKIKKNKIEIEFLLPAIDGSLSWFPFYLSGYLPVLILLISGWTLFPGFYVGPGTYGDQVKSSWLKK